jgi:hypothetical protein
MHLGGMLFQSNYKDVRSPTKRLRLTNFSHNQKICSFPMQHWKWGCCIGWELMRMDNSLVVNKCHEKSQQEFKAISAVVTEN